MLLLLESKLLLLLALLESKLLFLVLVLVLLRVCRAEEGRQGNLDHLIGVIEHSEPVSLT